jgi:beta-glucosidase
MKSKAQTKPVYLDKSKSVTARINDLLRRMTVAEKAAQLYGRWEPELFKGGVFNEERLGEIIGGNIGIGHLCAPTRSYDVRTGVELANRIQKFVLDKCRIKIPVLIHDEVLHGLMARGATSFPQAIALAASWDPDLMRAGATAIGKETRSRGIVHALTPTMNLARDPRCGRTEETYGEDPVLTAEMAVAFVAALQAQGVAATIKHFAANFVGDGGRDSGEIHFSERHLREVYLRAFREVIRRAGPQALMAAYNSLDGVPCSANKWLLTQVLRKEFGFKGVVVSDYDSVPHLRDKHKTAATYADAAEQALEAGLDVELPNPTCFAFIPELVRRRKLSAVVLDAAVRRVLELKFWTGIMDRPYFDVDRAVAVTDCAEHRALARKAAQECIVLLKNADNILPLSKSLPSIAVIGPNADTVRLGGYSGSGMKTVSPLEGIKAAVSPDTVVNFAQGCTIRGSATDGIAEAVEAARRSSVAVLFMGNCSGWTFMGDEISEGEDSDRMNLDLMGVQERLIKEVAATGTPTVVVLNAGGVVTMMNWVDSVQAVVHMWYAGEETGSAIADILFGTVNPSAKLPISYPKYTGQLPLYYNQKPSGRRWDYTDLRGEQFLFPFGFGLSYTTFAYTDLTVSPASAPKTGRIKVSVTVENTGKRDGAEVVQLYLTDVYARIARPVKELKKFQKLFLKAGEKKRVTFTLTAEDLAYLDDRWKPVVEPGEFAVLVGGSSASGLTGSFTIR